MCWSLDDVTVPALQPHTLNGMYLYIRVHPIRKFEDLCNIKPIPGGGGNPKAEARQYRSEINHYLNQTGEAMVLPV